MKFELPSAIKDGLASADTRLHHLLWHSIRNSWHLLDAAEQAAFKTQYPGWAPKIPRFKKVAPSAANPSGQEINFEAGESFLYMHRQMLASVNAQLIALGQPVITPWPAIPALDDADYPVPVAPPHSAKSDATYQLLKQREASITAPAALAQYPLAFIGAYVESGIHDYLHMRFAREPGQMSTFPTPDAFDVSPTIPAEFLPASVDYLGHPFASHVNSDFWMLHGWVDSIIEKWRVANGLETITWSDTWSGDVAHPHHFMDGAHEFAALERLAMIHDHVHGGPHEHGSNMMDVLHAVGKFSHCVVGFDYVSDLNLKLPEL